jgi:SAM-dependent methyltransferase
MVMKGSESLHRPRSFERKPDFGTYHHSTPKRSERTRAVVARAFLEAFDTLPFSRNQEVDIMDLGCGLGFLSCVCAKFYRRARVTGIDTFEHESLKGSSLEKANENSRILGLSDRVHFERGDMLSSDYGDMEFDLFVSNLVFHNLGRKRFGAYDRLLSWMSPNSHALLGDAFREGKGDMKYLANVFRIDKEIEPKGISWAPYKILALSKA